MSWTPKPLSEILEQSGNHRAGDRDFPVLSITMKHGLVDQADKFKKRIASTDTSHYRIAHKNELVVGFPIDEGVLGFQTKYVAGIVSPAYDIWKLRNAAECHIPYLEYYLRSPQARRLYASRMQGAVARRRSLTKADFLNLEIPFPPVNDQIRIAHLLGKVEGLIAQRKQHLQQLDDLLKSVFLEMFGDPVRNERGWKTSTIDGFCEAVVDCPHNTPEYSEGTTGYYCVRSSDIVEGYLDLSKTYQVDEKVFEDRIARYCPQVNDIVYSREGGRLGNAARIIEREPICLGQRIMLFRVGSPNRPEFLWALLESVQFKSKLQGLIGGGAAPRVNIKDLKKLVVIKPDPDLQLSFSKFVSRIDELKVHYQQSLADLKALYGTLSQQAFKGALDLSRVPLPDEQGQPMRAEHDELQQQADQSPLPVGAITPTEVINQLVQAAQPQGRNELLARWLRQYLTNTSPDASLGSAQFLESAWQTLQETQLETDGETPALTLDDYDALKDLVFKALASGELNQTFDGDSNRVVLQKRPANWGTW